MNGHDRERQLRSQLQGQGWWCVRAAGSLGDADIVALREGHTPRMLELKANLSGGPFKNFGPRDRGELLEAARVAGAEAWLVHWPARKEPRWLRGPDDWPT